MNILILGSCVTRDAFDLGNYKNDGLAHIHYFARTSLISLNTEPFHVDVNDIDGVNLFQKRLIASEMNREFYNYSSADMQKWRIMIIFCLPIRSLLLTFPERFTQPFEAP